MNILIDSNKYLFKPNKYSFAGRLSNKLFFWVYGVAILYHSLNYSIFFSRVGDYFNFSYLRVDSQPRSPADRAVAL